MRPLVVPASTTNAGLGAAVTIIVTWIAKQWGGIEVPDYVAQSFTAIVTVFLAHITTDTPPAPVAREAVDDAADKVDAAKAADDAAKPKP